MKEELRKLLNIPDDIRIGQHIYNQCREYETEDKGIDIFNVSDEDLIELLEK